MSMYIPKAYVVDDEGLLNEVIEKHAFATVIVTQNNQPHIVHLPLMLEASSRSLKGHIARSNPIASLDLSQPYHCIAIFQGPNTYISPSWYTSSKEETGRVVPTWNYIAVHVTGRLSLFRDSDWLLDTVTKLSEKFEPEYSEWQLSDAPKAYVSAMLNAITGFEISIECMEGNFKLSQDKKLADFQGALDNLSRQPAGSSQNAEILAWMHRMYKNNES